MVAFGGLAVPVATAVLVVFCSLVGIVSVNRLREDLFHPLVLVGFILLYYVLAPAGYLIVTGTFRWPRAYSHPISELAVALFLLTVTYVLIVLGFRFVDLDRFVPEFGALDLPDRRSIEPSVLVWVGLLGFVVGLGFYLYYVTINGGIVRLLTITPRNAFQSPNTGRYRLLGTAGLFAGLITTCTGLRPRIERNEFSRLNYLLLGVMVVVTLGVAASLRSRMNIVIPAAYVLLYFYTTDHISTRAVVVGGIALGVFGSMFTFFETIGGGPSLSVLIRGFVNPVRIELFTATVQAVPAEHPYQYGKTLLWALPVRPADMPLRYGDQLEVIVYGKNREYLTFPAMIFGELWLNFGPIGLFTGGVLFGGALSAVYTLHRRASGYLANGLYPLALLTVLVALPTSIKFAVQSVLFRLCIPVVLAVGVAYGYSRFVDTKPWQHRS